MHWLLPGVAAAASAAFAAAVLRQYAARGRPHLGLRRASAPPRPPVASGP
jgi:hypothetical protein